MQSFIYGLRKRDFIGDADIIAWMDAGMQMALPLPRVAGEGQGISRFTAPEFRAA